MQFYKCKKCGFQRKNSTSRFLTEDEEFTEQPSSVRQCSSLLHVGGLGLIINICFICFFF